MEKFEELEEYYLKAITKGIEREEYIALSKIFKNYKTKYDNNISWDYIHQINEYQKWIRELAILTNRYSEETIDYVKKNSRVLSIVFANNDDQKFQQRNGTNYLFNCQFHKEKTNSMGVVNDERNFYHCFGCGETGKVHNYLREYYNLSYIKAVEMAAAIYKIDLPRVPEYYQDEIKRIQQVIVGAKYNEVLENEIRKKQEQGTLTEQDLILHRKQEQQINNIYFGKSDQDFEYKPPTKVKRVLLTPYQNNKGQINYKRKIST